MIYVANSYTHCAATPLKRNSAQYGQILQLFLLISTEQVGLRPWIHERFNRGLISRENFNPQVLPNSRKVLEVYATCSIGHASCIVIGRTNSSKMSSI